MDVFRYRRPSLWLLLFSVLLNIILLYYVMNGEQTQSSQGHATKETIVSETCTRPGDLRLDGKNQFHIAGWRSGREGLYSLEFQTFTDSRGVLFAEVQLGAKKGDYIILRLDEGNLVLEFDAGHGLVRVSNAIVGYGGLCDAKWHRASVERRGNEAWLDLDGKRVRAQMPGSSREINTNSGLYVGGLPSDVILRDLGVDGRTISVDRFRGCVRNLVLNGKNVWSEKGRDPVSTRNDGTRMPVDNDVPIVTAFSDNHYKEALDLIGSIQTHMPSKSVIVYDLGLGPSALDRSLCQVKVRHFDFSRYPNHVKDLKQYAWKPIIIQEVLSQHTTIFWADASVRFQSNFAPLLPRLDSIPFLGRHTVGTVTAWTHPNMLTSLEASSDAIGSSRMIAATLFLIRATDESVELIVKPWVACALKSDCIAPEGSKLTGCSTPEKETDYNGCHRYDQSALNVLLFKALGDERKEACTDDTLVNKLTVTTRHPTNDFVIKTC